MTSYLATKFFVPPAPGQVVRSRLTARLAQAVRRPLVLVSAPPGFGKTTLLASWIQQAAKDHFGTVCWLALDDADNDPARYWMYMTAALRPLFKADGPEAEARLERLGEKLESNQPPSWTAFLDALINEVVILNRPGILFLDDYHNLTQPQIHEGMGYLVEHLPPGLHLVIATRADPPLPLARMRARGQLAEVRAADLRFTGEETGAFLEQLTGLSLTPEMLALLETSTEGWAAGLQMAALALAGQDAGGELSTGQVQAFLENFSGKHHYVLDYLAEEVFYRQPEAVQAFLLQTSVLDRFNAELCAAVTNSEGTGDETAFTSLPYQKILECQAMLETLTHANLFLVALDGEREWFRYHHLFVDLLRVRLRQSAPERIPILHRRASGWFEAHGLTTEAVRHALSGQDWDRAARLVEANVDDYLERGQLSTVMAWVKSLPRDVISRRPRLCVQLVWALAFANLMGEAGEMIRIAYQALEQADLDIDEAARMRGGLGLLQAYGQLVSGEAGKALVMVDAIRQALPADAVWELGWAWWMRGYAQRTLSDLDGADQSLREAIRLRREEGPESRSAWNLMVFLNDLAILEELRGRQRRAEALNREALALGERSAHGYLSRVEAGLSQILYQQNRLDEAMQHARKAVEYSTWWPSSNHRVLALVTLARMQIVLGDLDGAEQSLEQADAERRQSPVLAANDSLFENIQVRLWLAREDLLSAGRWADQRQVSDVFEQPLKSSSEPWMLAVARVRSAQGNFDEGLRLLARVEESSRAAGRTRVLIEALMMRAAVLYQKAGNQAVPEAQDYLAESLRLAGDEDFTRMYLDEGEPVRVMMDHETHEIHEQERGQEDNEYQKGKSTLVEPLTDREMEVLGLLVKGMSNKEMAERLYVSEGTIKTHVHNLMAKLDAQSRTHAVAVARELGLV